MMCCNRFVNRNGQVMGEFGTTRIALRGPGCINGTGRCNVAGARGRCTNVFGTGDDLDDVMGAGRRRCDRFDDNDNVQGAGERRCSNLLAEVLEAAGRRRCNNVLGTGGGRRNRRCDCCDCLETPITVPR
jgi:hypothetical protein